MFKDVWFILFQALKSSGKEDMCFLFPSRFLTGAHSSLNLFLKIDTILQFNSFSIFQLHSKIPSSFKGREGKIVHKVKAELQQSMKLTKKAKTHFTFVSKADMDIPGLMVRNCWSFKKMQTFNNECSLSRRGNYLCSFNVGTCAFRNPSMMPRINLSKFLALEAFQWMFTPSGWDTSKVII